MPGFNRKGQLKGGKLCRRPAICICETTETTDGPQFKSSCGMFRGDSHPQGRGLGRGLGPGRGPANKRAGKKMAE